MILVITHKTDFTADFIINKLNKRGILYRRFNCEDIIEYTHEITFGRDFKLSLMGESNFKSVWFRRTKHPDLKTIPLEQRNFLLTEIESFSKNLFAIIDAKWISDPHSVYHAENKLLQLKHAKEIGFKLPDTLITNDRESLSRFYRKHNGHVIIKPIAQTKFGSPKNPAFVFTNVLRPEFIDRINEFDLTPCIFQENIEKEYELRVTVVGDEVFAAAVDSQSDKETNIDWRRKKLTFKKIDIPFDVSAMCVKIVKVLNLQFGAIDLIKTKMGHYVFLEINPNGQWVWIENETGQKISDAIINLLTC